MKILLTGGNGMLGSSVKELSDKKNIEFYSTDVKDLDITDINQIESFINKFEIDIIINCAAYANVDGCEKNKELAYRVNSEGPRNLAELSEKYKLKLCHISTDYVYDCSSRQPLKETDNLNPLSTYGKSKLSGERNIQEKCDNFYILRTSWMFGYYGENFLKWIVKSSKNQNILNLISDVYGNPTYSMILSNIILKLVQTEYYNIYNVSNSGKATWYEFGEYIVKNCGYETKLQKVLNKELIRPAIRPDYSVMDISRIKTVLKTFIPDWRESVLDCLSHIK
jgi:dTDP-4-dehydrorhamnose reductase